MKKKTLAEQKLMLADLIEKGIAVLSREEKMLFVGHLCIFCELDVAWRTRCFAYPMGFALAAKLGGLEPARRFLEKSSHRGRNKQPYEKLGISKRLARLVHNSCTPYVPRSLGYKIVDWLRAETRKKGECSMCIFEPNELGLYSKKASAALKKLGIR